MNKGNTYQIVLDNAGGITLQIGSTYAHYYQEASRAAEDRAACRMARAAIKRAEGRA